MITKWHYKVFILYPNMPQPQCKIWCDIKPNTGSIHILLLIEFMQMFGLLYPWYQCYGPKALTRFDCTCIYFVIVVQSSKRFVVCCANWLVFKQYEMLGVHVFISFFTIDHLTGNFLNETQNEQCFLIARQHLTHWVLTSNTMFIASCRQTQSVLTFLNQWHKIQFA